MTPERWSEVERLCQAALELSVETRALFLAEACAGDDALRQEVESILAHEAGAIDFLPPIEAAVAVRAILSPSALAFEDGPAIRIGQTLGSYVISARLGEGGMGEVYRARDTTLGRDVAIKVLPAIFAADPDRLARFEREARMLASLESSPHRRDLRRRAGGRDSGARAGTGGGGHAGRSPAAGPTAGR